MMFQRKRCPAAHQESREAAEDEQVVETAGEILRIRREQLATKKPNSRRVHSRLRARACCRHPAQAGRVSCQTIRHLRLEQSCELWAVISVEGIEDLSGSLDALRCTSSVLAATRSCPEGALEPQDDGRLD